VPSFADYRVLPLEARLGRLERTPVELERAVDGKAAAELSRRPAAESWGVTEILCHLRDVEELFQTRFHTVLAFDEPSILVFGASEADLARWRIGGAVSHPLDPDRWAEDRQYRRSDPREALRAFGRRRGEVLALLRSLSPGEWQRVGIHPARGRLTLADWAASLAGHDDNHLDQLGRALESRV
jgi:hypothetical protein